MSYASVYDSADASMSRTQAHHADWRRDDERLCVRIVQTSVEWRRDVDARARDRADGVILQAAQARRRT